MVLEPVPSRSCLATKRAFGRTILGGGDCSSVSKAQQWEMLQSNTRRFAATTNEDAVAHVALTTNGQKDCVVRDSSIWSKAARLQRALSEGGSAGRERTPKGALANTVSVLRCDARGHTPLELTASNVANSGFLFQSADGAMCYDGVRFRECSDEDRTLRWGVGVRFSRGRPETSLYKFYNASESCLVELGDHVALGSCDAKGARGTSKFLMAQGAAPTKCIIHGPSTSCAHVGQAAFFYITARDAYGNLSRNGGEVLPPWARLRPSP